MKPKSKCCNAPADVFSSDEGTSFYACGGCGKACDIRLSEGKNFFDLPLAKKKKIVDQAVRESNKMQRDIVKRYEKDKQIHPAFKLELERLDTTAEVESHIAQCEGKCIQQVVYSTYHRGLTQVCFGCRKVRTSIDL